MSNTPFGFNVHGQSKHGLNRARLLDYVSATQPRVMLIMDDLGLAQEVQAAAPECRVIARNNFPGGVMDNLLENLTGTKTPTPQQINDAANTTIAHYGPAIDLGVACYVDNESAFNPYKAEYYIETMRRASQVGGKMVVGNFSHGTPGENQYGLLDEVIKTAMYSGGAHSIGVHEYIVDYPAKHHPHLIGRVGRIIERSRAIYGGDASMPPPFIDITESGFDIVQFPGGVTDGARGLLGHVHLWRANGFRGDYITRAADYLLSLWDTYYRHYGAIRGMCLFSYGAVTDTWLPYDFSQYLELIDRLQVATFDTTTPDEEEEEPMPTGTAVQITHGYDGFGLRLRATPAIRDDNKLATLGSGVQVYTDYVTASGDGYEWLKIRYGSLEGWIAYDGANNHTVDIQPPIPVTDNSAVVDKLRVALSAIQDAIAELES